MRARPGLAGVGVGGELGEWGSGAVGEEVEDAERVEQAREEAVLPPLPVRRGR